MPFTPDYLETKGQVATALQSHGWRIVHPTSMKHTIVVATRQFVTAVGLKQATAFLSTSGTLTADYQSEGRNVLSTVWHNVENHLADECVAEVVATFNAEVEQTVEQSFAARLIAH